MPIKPKNPFYTFEKIVQKIYKKYEKPIIFVDFHGETTAEKYGMAHIFQEKIHALVGTHTHIQTNDAHVLFEKKPFIMADAGMC